MVNPVFITGKNYYPQVSSEECKIVIKEKKIPEHFTDNMESSSYSDREDSGEENSNEKNSDEESLNEEN